ncbi:MAG: DUF362 domain-containing protein [Verrucomicrobiia bacterium]|jgi:uncharacterized protein (DUF362 family)
MTATLNRRQFVKKLAIGATGGAVLGLGLGYWRNREPASRVTILKAKSYTENLADLVKRALQDYPAVIERARGRRVVLKPNLVEYYEARGVNTHPALVAAAIGAFRSLGAREVIVAEGPGHQRDTEMLIEQSGLDDALKAERTVFVDLNLDSTHPVPLRANYTRLGRLFFPDTILGADLVVSMPKLKTHHWVGATLSLKNMFGTVPGVKYGWPKNVLHWCGDQSIEKSIVDINLALQPGFAIVDGIEGMEGDGPLRGETVQSGVIIMGDNLTAVDATGARVMGLNPERLNYLQVMQRHGGTLSESRIEQLGETVGAVRCDFKVLPPFTFLKLTAAGRNMPQEENCG